MARYFKILDKEYVDWLFVGSESHTPEGYISYRQVIEHGLFALLHHSSKMTKDDCKECLAKIKECFDKEEDYTENDLFLRLYHLKAGGVVVIDKTRWCYPLVFIDNRVVALKMALKNIERNIDPILNLLGQANIWDLNLQNKLEAFHDIPSQKKAA